MRDRFMAWALVAGVAGCASSSASFDRGVSLAASGDDQGAIAAFDRVCGEAPTSPKCPEAQVAAAAAHLHAADVALAHGDPVIAERHAMFARATSDPAASEKATSWLARDDVKRALATKRALSFGAPAAALASAQAAASAPGAASALASAWLATSRPALIVEAVRAACGPRHDGSCSERGTELASLAAPPPGSEDAKGLVGAEQKRLVPLRKEAEAFLFVFAQDAKKRLAYDECLKRTGDNPSGSTLTTTCQTEIYGDDAPDGYRKRYQLRANNERLWRVLMRSLADDALVDSYEARKKKALADGEVAKAVGPGVTK